MPKKAGEPPIVPRKTPRQARSRRTQHDLLEGATRVLARDGAARFTTNRVAAATGVSVGSLYQYFGSKEALLATLHDREGAALAERLDAVLSDASQPPRARLVAMLTALFVAQAEAHALHDAMARAEVAATETAGFEALARALEARLATFLAEAGAAECAAVASYARTVVLALLAQVARDGTGVDEAAALGARTGAMLGLYAGLE